MRKIRGQQLFLFANKSIRNLEPLALSTDCELSISADIIRLCRQGVAERSRAGLASWGVSCRGLYALGTDNNITSSPSLLIGQPFSVGFSVIKKELARIGIVEESHLSEEATLVGTVIISNIKIGGSRAGISTYRTEFTGVGELGLLSERNGFPYILPILL